MLDEARPGRVLAVLDWELFTLGDPMADLAYLCLPYHLPRVRQRSWMIPSLVQICYDLCCNPDLDSGTGPSHPAGSEGT